MQGNFASRAGSFLFRWRGHLPFLLAPVVVLAVVPSQRAPQPRAAELGWEIACFAVALLGWTIRAYTVGTAAPGTSGRNTRRQKAHSLNVTGPYSVVRHPLYLANSLIALALALFSHTWLLPLFIAVAAPAYYGTIARSEEVYLRGCFGPAFEAWAARVPAVFPRVTRFVPAARKFDWGAVRRREINSLTVIAIAPLFIDVVDNTSQQGTLSIEPVWMGFALVGLVLFSMARVLRRRRHTG